MKWLVFSDCGCAEVLEDGTNPPDTLVFSAEDDDSVLLISETAEDVLAP